MFLTTLALSVMLCAALTVAAEESNVQSPRVVPLPEEMQAGSGEFALKPATRILAAESLAGEAEYLQSELHRATGYPLNVTKLSGDSNLPTGVIALNITPDTSLGDEGYRLEVAPERVEITASTAAGVFYGIQTLFQLLPAQVSSPGVAQGVKWSVPAVRIKDRPRFGWRSYLLDDARWFHGEAEVKRLLDQMTLLKLNRFLWYLTDDQGWRIEIKKYPKLTTVGAWRKDTQVGKWESPERSGKPHGGFYSQEQVREVVRYAAERHITIVPVISMPGHATAAIASYPEMGTAHRQVEVETTFGKKPDTFNVSDEKVYTFLEDILTEVMELFPSKVIHLGGDEVLFEQWMASPEIKALIEREHLSGPAGVQLYFTNRMSQFLQSRGRRMMGWNEIMGDDIHGSLKAVGGVSLSEQSGGSSLAKSTIVQFWAGDIKLATRAVSQGYRIVNSYHAGTYLDYTYDEIPLSKAYAFDPIPPGLDPKYYNQVMGLGCQMWSEWTPTAERIEQQTFPRIAAYAEVGWTQSARKDYAGFCRGLDSLQRRWELQGIAFARVPR